jgi:hypothetical protein
MQQYDLNIPYASLLVHAKNGHRTEVFLNRLLWLFAGKELRAEWREQEMRSAQMIQHFTALAADEARAKQADIARARKKDPFMTESRLPKPIEDALCAVDDDHLARSLRHYLGFGNDKGMRDSFIAALLGEDVSVWEDQAETDPCEIVVRATGTLANGGYFSKCNIILLDPWWSKQSDVSHGMAARIVEVWDEISELAKTINAKEPA